MENSHGELLNIIDFVFFSDEKAKVGIGFAEFL